VIAGNCIKHVFLPGRCRIATNRPPGTDRSQFANALPLIPLNVSYNGCAIENHLEFINVLKLGKIIDAQGTIVNIVEILKVTCTNPNPLF